mgnify:CR=1 FL=1
MDRDGRGAAQLGHVFDQGGVRGKLADAGEFVLQLQGIEQEHAPAEGGDAGGFLKYVRGEVDQALAQASYPVVRKGGAAVGSGHVHDAGDSPGRVEDEVVMENMDLVQITEMDGEYWFVLRQFSATELAMAKMSSNIDFLAMMQDVEL